jgi:eukaryotic-like serine/threonine-protein kinase
MVGKILGHYQVSNPLGKGGMGEVYRARDTKLNRHVALKVLPAEFASDPERMVRFKREAQLLASLNHPNIAAIYGLEESGGVSALVMELVEGSTLAERISKGSIPLDEMLTIARQIAEALEAAHEKGIIHRDLKPANIKVTPEGAVKVLDFGLAKALEGEVALADASQSPTLSLAATKAGVILGTAAYMSPEQARGAAVDKRCDIWSFGVVLFEMLTGKQLFEGETVSDTLAAVLRADIDWNLLPTKTPASIRTLLRRCLTKDRKRRLRDIGDAVIEPDVEAVTAVASQSIYRHPLLWVPALMAVAALISLAYALWSRPSSDHRMVTRLSIPMPPDQKLTDYPAISPDGRTIAYISQKGTEEQKLYLRSLNSFESKEVSGSSGAQQPFFSPDGKWIAFFAQGKLKKSGVAGGSPIEITEAQDPFGGTWNKDGTIIFAAALNSGLLRISENGGKTESLSKPDGAGQGYAHVWPQALPDGHSILFTVWGKGNGDAIFSLDSRHWRSVRTAEWAGSIFCRSAGSTGYLLPLDLNADIKAISIDFALPALTGSYTSVIPDVYFSERVGRNCLAVSDTGTAVYAQGNPAKRSLVWVDFDGKVEALGMEQGRYSWVNVSPDGLRALVNQAPEIWIYDLQPPWTHTRVTIPGNPGEETLGNSGAPRWSFDGKVIYFASNRRGNWDIYSQPADRSQAATVLMSGPNDQYPSSVGPDGTLLFIESHPMTGGDIWALSRDGKTAKVRATPSNEYHARFSPDGRWIAYQSDESGRFEIYVQGYPGGKAWPVSTGGGTMACWSRDSKQLFYLSGNFMMAATIRSDGSLASAPRKLFVSSGYFSESYDISHEGKRFLMIRLDPGSVPRELNVILNFSKELDRLAPVK